MIKLTPEEIFIYEEVIRRPMPTVKLNKRRTDMPAKKDHWAEMIKRTEAQIETFQTELIFADPPKTEAEAAVILQSIEDQIAKIEKLRSMQVRLKAK